MVDRHLGGLGLLELDGPTGVRVVEHPGDHDAALGALAHLDLGEVAVQDVVALVAAVAVDVGPRRTEHAALTLAAAALVPVEHRLLGDG